MTTTTTTLADQLERLLPVMEHIATNKDEFYEYIRIKRLKAYTDNGNRIVVNGIEYSVNECNLSGDDKKINTFYYNFDNDFILAYPRSTSVYGNNNVPEIKTVYEFLKNEPIEEITEEMATFIGELCENEELFTTFSEVILPYYNKSPILK